MMKYKLVIFDFDGTLADTSVGILNCVRHAQREMGLPQITSEQMYSFIGPSNYESYSRVFGLSGDRLEEAVKLHRNYAIEYGYKELEFYDGIPELLSRLRENGCKTAVVTLKAHATAVKIIDTFKLSDKFDLVMGVDPVAPLSKAELLKRCTARLGCEKCGTVLIGDSEYDMIGAKDSGISFIAVTYGFGFRENDKLFSSGDVLAARNVPEIASLLF